MIPKIRSYGRRQKYDAKSVDGFPSKLEAACYNMLHLMQKGGQIEKLKRQQTIKLTAAQIGYRVDFTYEKNGETVYVEAKGFETPEWKLKKRLWAHYGPGTLEIWGGSYKSLKLKETLRPNSKICNSCGRILVEEKHDR
jgi:hypothetical protein